MVFNSLAFFVFLPLVLLAAALSPRGWRWAVLLAASFLFYAWLGQAVLLEALAAVTIIGYTAGLAIQDSTTETLKRTVFYAAVALCVGVLAWLKYLPFFLENLAWLAGRMGLVARALPSVHPLAFIGVSYFTFQAISYLSDVYFGSQKAESHFGVFALYLAFFPKLLQGPIERAGSLLGQLRTGPYFDQDLARRGLLLFAWGFYKKVAVADRLAPFVANVFDNTHDQYGLSCILGAYYYAFQLYCDFSGYTDMALGLGLLFGIRLSPNFDAPYLAPSVAEFWRRWHISFTTCIRDYVFEPLQMAFRGLGKSGVLLSLVLSFAIVGLWHGAGWGFIAWGTLHGVFMAVSILTKKPRARLRRFLRLEGTKTLKSLQILCTFNLVCFSYLFFRAPNLYEAWAMASRLLQGIGAPGWTQDIAPAFYSGQSELDFWLALAALAAVPMVHFASQRVRLFEQPRILRWAAYYALAFAIFFGGRFYAPKQFIYFQF